MDITRLKQAKKEKRLTYEQLSKISGVPISTIYDMFRGVTTAPRIDTVQAIEKALGLTPPDWTEVEKANAITAEEAELLTLFRKLPPEGKDAVKRLVRSYMN